MCYSYVAHCSVGVTQIQANHTEPVGTVARELIILKWFLKVFIFIFVTPLPRDADHYSEDLTFYRPTHTHAKNSLRRMKPYSLNAVGCKQFATDKSFHFHQVPTKARWSRAARNLPGTEEQLCLGSTQLGKDPGPNLVLRLMSPVSCKLLKAAYH